MPTSCSPGFLIYLKTFKVLSFSIALDSEPSLEFLHLPCHYHVRTTCRDVRGWDSSDEVSPCARVLQVFSFAIVGLSGEMLNTVTF